MLNSGENTHTLREKNAKDSPGAPNSDLLREVPKLDSVKEPSKSDLPKEAPKSDTLKAQPPKPPEVSPKKVPQHRCIPSPQGVLKKYSRTSLHVPPRSLEDTASSTTHAQRSFESVESGSEDTMHKPRQKLNKPRMNRLTVQRIQRLQSAANVPEETIFSPRLKRQNSKLSPRVSSQGSVAELHPSGDNFECMLKKLKDLQTEFLKMAAGLQKSNNGVYKLVSVVQNDNCKFVLHKDELVGLPPRLPADLVNDLNGLCQEVMDSGYAILLDGLSKLQLAGDDASGEAASEAIRTELRKQMKSEKSKLEAIEQELLKFCEKENESDHRLLKRQISELTGTKNHLSELNSKLESQLSKIQSSNEDLRKLLNESQMENNKLALKLADKNIEMTEQNCKIEDQKKEIKHLKNVNKVVQQRLKENDEALAAQQSESSELKQREKLLQKEIADLKKRVRELSNSLTIKETELHNLHAKYHEQIQKEFSSGTDQAHIKELQRKLELQAEVERQLTTLVEQKQGLLNKLEQKVTRLEEQLEQHRQVLIVRGERINSLDTELKQRENESNRRITELINLTNDKNSIISQITNELTSTNEQFQNLCTTLSIKQSKLHSQEHVIKLLEESNARSVKLHTKLGEKNALLKDELEHLRRTVRVCVKILIGNNGKNIFEPVPAHEVPKH